MSEKINWFEEANFKKEELPRDLNVDEASDQLIDWSALEREAKRERLLTPEERRVIDKANHWLQEEFASLGIDRAYEPIGPDDVHILSADSPLLSRIGREGCVGWFQLLDQGEKFFKTGHVYIVDSEDPVDLTHRLVHELIHRATQTVVYHEVDFGAEQAEDAHHYVTSKSGYHNMNPKRREKRQVWKGFNEAIVEYSSVALVYRHYQELAEILNLPDKTEPAFSDFFDKYEGYSDYVDLLLKLVTVWGKRDPIKMGQATKKLKQGLYTGKVMPLREIDQAFPDSKILKQLSILGMGNQETDYQILELLYQTIRSQETKNKTID